MILILKVCLQFEVCGPAAWTKQALLIQFLFLLINVLWLYLCKVRFSALTTIIEPKIDYDLLGNFDKF